MKKQLIIAALLLALAVLAFMLLYTVTVYPAFQKSVGSIDTLRQALRSDAILYPAVEDLLQEPNYTLSLDGRTVFAKPVGYVIDGTEPYADMEIYYLFTGSTTPHSSQTTVEEIAYRDVAIRRWDHGNLNDSGALYRVNLTFSQDGYFYTLSASFGGAALQPGAQLTPELRTALATHAQDTLLSQCQQMIDGF